VLRLQPQLLIADNGGDELMVRNHPLAFTLPW
jgi:hypothetical protein